MIRGGIVIRFTFYFMLVTSSALAVDQSICNSTTTITLHPNGMLKSCMLKDPYETKGIKCKSGEISFYDDGKLDGCFLAETVTVDDVSCKESSPISFYPNGKLKSCVNP